MEIILCRVKQRNIRMAGENACHRHFLGLEEEETEFPNFRKKGQSQEVVQNFRNEFPETFCSIQFCTSGNFGPIDCAPEIVNLRPSNSQQLANSM